MYSPVCNPDTQAWEQRTSEQLKQMNKKGSIAQFTRGARLEWAGHVRRAEDIV